VKIHASYPGGDTRAPIKAEREAERLRSEGTSARVRLDSAKDDFQVVTDDQPQG
jgi:hypothetical protein